MLFLAIFLTVIGGLLAGVLLGGAILQFIHYQKHRL